MADLRGENSVPQSPAQSAKSQAKNAHLMAQALLPVHAIRSHQPNVVEGLCRRVGLFSSLLLPTFLFASHSPATASFFSLLLLHPVQPLIGALQQLMQRLPVFRI